MEQNHLVRAFVLPLEDIHQKFPPQVEVVRGDISVPSDVERAVQNIAGAIHLAAVVGDAGTDDLHQRVTVGGTRYLLESCP